MPRMEILYSLRRPAIVGAVTFLTTMVVAFQAVGAGHAALVGLVAFVTDWLLSYFFKL